MSSVRRLAMSSVRRLVMLVVASTLVLAACTVPRDRDVGTIDKVSATDAEVAAVYKRYRQVRNTATGLLDPKPLSTIETGPALAIDTGSFEVSQRLNATQKESTGKVQILDVQTPRFTRYPLWYFSVVRDASRDVKRVQIFERASSVDPWLLVSTPETLADTRLPEIRAGARGDARRVKPSDGNGMAMSVDDVAVAYARTLGDPQAPEAATIENDSFIQQMRDAAAVNAGLKGVTFGQQWAPEKVQYALRTSDGGALAFVTLLRTDTYTVPDGFQVTWPDGSPQQAFLQAGIQGTGTLNYYHQVLIYLPGGKQKPRALGQFGGVVSGDAGGEPVGE